MERTLALDPHLPHPLRAGAAALGAWIALLQGGQHAADMFLDDCHDPARQRGEGDPLPAGVFVVGAHTMLVREAAVAASNEYLAEP